MKFLALERESPGRTAAEFQPHLRAEAARLWDLYRAGTIRECYFDARQHTAMLMLECPDADTARAALDSLPLVQHGLIMFEMVPLVPYDGFSRLLLENQPENPLR